MIRGRRFDHDLRFLPHGLPSPAARDACVGELIELVGGVDGIVQAQARADAGYFLAATGIAADDGLADDEVRSTLLKAHCWQYIVSGALHSHFRQLLARLVDAAQLGRIEAALAPLAYSTPRARARQSGRPT